MANYFRSWFLRVACITIETPLKMIYFYFICTLFSIRYNFCCRNGCLCLLLSALGSHLAQTHVGPKFGAPVSVSSYLSVLLCLLGLVSLVLLISRSSYTLWISCSRGFPKSSRKVFAGYISCRTESSKISQSLLTIQLWVSAIVPIYCKENL